MESLKTPPYRGWIVVGAAFTVMMVGFTCAYAYATFFPSLETEFKASRARISSVFAVAGAVYFLLGAVSGPLADRFGARAMAVPGMLVLAAGLGYAGFARSLTDVFIGFAVGIGVGVGFSYVPAVGAVQRWFTARRAMASGIAVSGIGVGTLAGPLVATLIIDAWDWRTGFFVLAAIALSLGVIGALALDDNRAGLTDAHDAGSTGARLAGPNLLLSEAVRTRPFWLMFFSWSALSFALFVPFVHLVPFALDHGMDASAGAFMLGCIGVGSTAGRFVVGGIADRHGRVEVMGACFLGVAAAMLWWMLSSSFWALAVFGLVFGTCYGGFVALAPAVAADHFGTRGLGGIIGLLYSGVGIGTLLGPPFAGLVFDRSGSYEVAILAGAGAALLATTLLVMLPHSADWRRLMASG